MKKHNLLKTLGIFFLVLVALTWIIPTGTFSGSDFTKGTTDPIGIFDIFRLPFMTIGTFIQYGLVFLTIGGLYGVLNKTGVYAPLVEKIAKKWKGKERIFLAIVVTSLALLASISGLSLPLFTLVPFLITIILLMGLSKLTALVSTVGAILVGMIGSTYGFNVTGYINNFFSLDVNNQILTKIILFAMLVILLVFFVITNAKKELAKSQEVSKKENTTSKKETKKKSEKATKKEEVIVETEKKKSNDMEIPFYDSSIRNTKSALPLVIISIISLLIVLLFMYNWFYGFKVSFFQDIYTSLMEIKIGSYPIMENLLSGISQFGYWNNYDLIATLVITSLLIGWIYSIKFKDVVDSFLEGAKKMIGVAFYVTICSTLFAVIISSSNGTIFNTITNFFLGTSKTFNVFATAFTTMAGGLLYNEFSYFLDALRGLVSTNYDATTLEAVGLVFQTIYGFMMMLLPTSMILIAGLRYLEISYKEWLKYIWKFLLAIFVVIMVVLFVAGLFI